MTDTQKKSLEQLCSAYEVEFKEEDFHRSFSCGEGWIEGWIGKHIYVGCSPEGSIHS